MAHPDSNSLRAKTLSVQRTGNQRQIPTVLKHMYTHIINIHIFIIVHSLLFFVIICLEFYGRYNEQFINNMVQA